MKAFARQIEMDPFHESAYAQRAYVLLDMDRSDEAEKDLLKQIEVAPLKAWSHERLAKMRMEQQRFDEAARYFSAAAALDAKKAENWIELGWAHAMSRRPGEALAALARGRALDPPIGWRCASPSGFTPPATRRPRVTLPNRRCRNCPSA